MKLGDKLDLWLLKFSQKGKDNIRKAYIDFLKESNVTGRVYIDNGFISNPDIKIIRELLIYSFVNRALENTQKINKKKYSEIEREYILKQIFNIILSVELGDKKKWIFWRRNEINDLKRKKEIRIQFLFKSYYFYCELREELSEIIKEYILLVISNEKDKSSDINTKFKIIEKRLKEKLKVFFKKDIDDSLSLVKDNLVFFISIACNEFILEQLESFSEIDTDKAEKIKGSFGKNLFNSLKSIEDK